MLAGLGERRAGGTLRRSTTKGRMKGHARPKTDHASRRLFIFAKFPRAGEVKTRLTPALGTRGAARLYGAFLDDTVRMVREIEGVTRELWVVRRPDAVHELRERYRDFAVREQPDGDLGDRMRGAFDFAFDERARCAVIIGSDHPTLPASHVRRVLEALALGRADVVLGPTEDGGYYAIGLRLGVWPLAAGLFDDIAWSTSAVLAQTHERAEELGLRLAEGSRWYDVDEPHQLKRLLGDADPESATARTLQTLHVLDSVEGVVGSVRSGPATPRGSRTWP